MDHPLISVVIPIYNVEYYLNECINSILNQTYNNLEIILVDDGSTDNSGNIAEHYASKDQRIKLIHKQKGGLSDARNTGIDIANGSFITFVDSDDALCPDTIEYLHNLLVDSDADISCCQRIQVNEDSNISITQNRHKPKQSFILSTEKALISQFVDTVAWGKLYKIELFSNVRYPLGRLHEDVFTTYKLLAQCKVIVVGEQPKYMYRLRNNSISNINFTHRHLDIIYGKIERAEYLRINFPKLYPSGKADIVYSACVCTHRMAKARYRNNDDIAFVQKQIRRYEKDFLIYGKNRIATKLFSIATYINLRITIKLLEWFQ